jgi:radical SAM protein with 4Fe4S-binding SPASM domain
LQALFVNCTDHCNLACRHCIKAAGPSFRTAIAKDLLFAILDEFAELGGKVVIFTGGEPFLYPHLREALLRAGELKLDSLILTNGTLLDEPWARLLGGLKVRLHVSLEGPTAETNDAVRGTGSFELAVRGARRLTEACVDWGVQTTVSSQNAELLPDILRLAKELGARNLAVANMDRYGRAATNHPELIPTRSQQRYIAEVVKRVADIGSLPVESTYLQWLALFENGRPPEPNGYLLRCGAGRVKCAITADGIMLPCLKFFQMPCGNVAREGFTAVWERSTVLRSLRQLAQTRTVEANATCAKCRFAPCCNGGCRAVVHNETGDLYGPDPICWQQSQCDLCLVESHDQDQ